MDWEEDFEFVGDVDLDLFAGGSDADRLLDGSFGFNRNLNIRKWSLNIRKWSNNKEEEAKFCLGWERFADGMEW